MNHLDRKRPFDQTLADSCRSLKSMKMDDNDWKRTGNKNIDLLHFYKTGQMYDCSFKVGCSESDYEVFKCHKVVLGMASSVFQKMFSGDFKEATQERDEQIILERIQSTVFDAAMKFIYGDKKDFGNVETAVQIYRFAHEMQIPSLFWPLKLYLKEKTSVENVLSVLDLYNLFGNDDDLRPYWEILYRDVKTALKSKSWLMLPPSMVERVLKEEFLPIDEAILFSSLLDWGRNQALCAEGVSDPKSLDAADDKKARDKVLPLLKHIRFRAMLSKDFAKISRTSKILTSDERCQIYECLALNTSEWLSEELKNSKVCDRTITVPILPYEFWPSTLPLYHNAKFTFAVDRKVYLVGVCVDQSDPNFGPGLSCTSITLKDSTEKVLSSSINLNAVDTQSGKVIELQKTARPLNSRSNYTLTFANINKLAQLPNKTYKISDDSLMSLKQPGITVSLKDRVIQVYLKKLVFHAGEKD